MKLGVPREIAEGERRVAATPETVKRLIKLGFEVLIEAGAGALASFPDAQYAEAGAELVPDARSLWSASDVVLKVRPPVESSELGVHEAELLREGATLISFIWPAQAGPLLDRLAARRATVIAMDQIPRISRAQKMDALSSMANIAGYRAVVEAAAAFGRFFTGQITAAGKVPPAKVLVIGAGVAGLAAIGAARGLGAIVRAFDTRPAVKEQVESMGAEFLDLAFEEDGTGEGGYAKQMSQAFIDAEMALFEAQAREVDIIITTALIPGRPAPTLITRQALELMRPGSVVVDLAAEAGGNCELTVPGELTVHQGVSVIGYVDLPSRLAPTASQLYGTNLVHLLTDMGGGENFRVDKEDEVVRGALVLDEGQLCWPPPKREAPPAPPIEPAPKPIAPPPEPAVIARRRAKQSALGLACCGALLALLGLVAPPAFLGHLTVFVLACFVGWQVVWNVTPALHTPLMSVTNAVSGIIIVGGMLTLGGPLTSAATWLSAAAVLLATINIAGGFLVTQRMLRMFQK
ncbi:MAG: Re/Si-specific NAD(P)(+) transhydrogenase subunit alpha [Polyangiaceae bacterium]|nr:Re/Si-specific NAD(P)(+) transhydrogenase subunit alpha [Polyangiaceae bacterium]MCW5790336.1 Re/Si-specific NAD(P)(+) transhydrogenase subunit alpha [Polyangiaceae bacterium]